MTDKPRIPFNVKAFIDRVTPAKGAMPIDELDERLSDSARGRLGYMPLGKVPHGVEQIVEIRIRKWMQAEKLAKEAGQKEKGQGETVNDVSKDPKKSSHPKI